MLSFYEHNKAAEDSKKANGHLHDATGRGSNYVDVPPAPVRDPIEVSVICYKPRPGERRVEFAEVGYRPVEQHPRFDLDYAADDSEGTSARSPSPIV